MKTEYNLKSISKWIFNRILKHYTIWFVLMVVLIVKTYHVVYKPRFNSGRANDNSTRNIYFIKIHKTGSSTLQNIIYRYSLQHQLKVALFNMPSGMPYPNEPHPKYLYEDILQPNFVPYNVLCDHAKFSREAVKMYMVPNYTTVTIIRHPLSHLRSSFSFWRIDRAFRLLRNQTKGHHDDPIRTFLLNNPFQFENTQVFRTKIQNMQCHHLGYSGRSNSQVLIQDFIRNISSQLDLVLILERMDESLLLLKNYFKWELQDVLYIKQFVKQRNSARYSLLQPKSDKELEDIHMKISRADYDLYHHFADVFEKEISKQGSGFFRELEYFKQINKQVLNFCQQICDVFRSRKQDLVSNIKERLFSKHISFPETVFHGEFKVSLVDCSLMTIITPSYQKAFRTLQMPTVCLDKEATVPSSIDWCDKSQYLFHTFPLAAVKDSVLSDFKEGPKTRNQKFCEG